MAEGAFLLELPGFLTNRGRGKVIDVSDFEKRRGSRRRRAETGAHARPPWRAGGV
jgi:hypothetical protein